MLTVKRNWDHPILLEFKDWLKDKAEAHERMKLSSGKPETQDSHPLANIIKTKTAANFSASTSPVKHHQWESKRKVLRPVDLLVKKCSPL